MGETTLGADELEVILVVAGLFAVAVVGAFLQMRNEWKALRHKLFRPGDETARSSRPGRVVERLSPARLGVAARETLDRLARDLESGGDAEGASAARAVAGLGELDEIVAEVAGRTMAAGDLRSVLVRLGGAMAYVLAFPGKREDPRTVRRHGALSDGWPAHAARIRGAAGGAEAPPLVALLYFLGPDARDGSLLVAYEGDRGSRFPEELAEVATGMAVVGESTLAHEFALV